MKYFLWLSLIGLMGCGHHRDVRVGAEGVHRVVVAHEDKEQGPQDAIKQANHFCDERKMQAAIISESTKYIGSVDETTYNRTKMVTRAVKTAGGTTMVTGGKREKNVGGIGALGGVTADAALGNGYSTEMSFKCI